MMFRILMISSIIFSGHLWGANDQEVKNDPSTKESYVFSENDAGGVGGSVFAGDSLVLKSTTSHLLSYGGNFFFSFGALRLGVEGALMQKLDDSTQTNGFYFGPSLGAAFKIGVLLIGVSTVVGYGNYDDHPSFALAPGVQLGLYLTKGSSVSLVGKYIMFMNGSQTSFTEKSLPFFGLQVSFGSV